MKCWTQPKKLIWKLNFRKSKWTISIISTFSTEYMKFWWNKIYKTENYEISFNKDTLKINVELNIQFYLTISIFYKILNESIKLKRTSEYLIKKQLDMVLCEHLRTWNDLVQIALHQLGENVNFMEEVGERRLQTIDRMQNLSIQNIFQLISKKVGQSRGKKWHLHYRVWECKAFWPRETLAWQRPPSETRWAFFWERRGVHSSDQWPTRRRRTPRSPPLCPSPRRRSAEAPAAAGTAAAADSPDRIDSHYC